MEERERMLDTIMVMQEFNIKKDKQIEELEQENKVLKDRWEKLKGLIKQNCEIYKNNCDSFVMVLASKGAETFSEIILDKMQDLEKGEKK